jgi:hypothetical protein
MDKFRGVASFAKKPLAVAAAAPGFLKLDSDVEVEESEMMKSEYQVSNKKNFSVLRIFCRHTMNWMIEHVTQLFFPLFILMKTNLNPFISNI